MWRAPSFCLTSALGAVRTCNINCIVFWSMSFRFLHAECSRVCAADTGDTKSSNISVTKFLMNFTFPHTHARMLKSIRVPKQPINRISFKKNLQYAQTKEDKLNERIVNKRLNLPLPFPLCWIAQPSWYCMCRQSDGSQDKVLILIPY